MFFSQMYIQIDLNAFAKLNLTSSMQPTNKNKTHVSHELSHLRGVMLYDSTLQKLESQTQIQPQTQPQTQIQIQTQPQTQPQTQTQIQTQPQPQPHVTPRMEFRTNMNHHRLPIERKAEA